MTMFRKAKREAPLPGQVMHTVANLDSYEAIDSRFITEDIEVAQVTTSLIAGQPAAIDSDEEGLIKHKIVLDIDMPAQLIPSSTPGHFHLYVDHEITWHDYQALLHVMGDVGLLEPGYVGASLARGHTALRLPWIKKPKPVVVSPMSEEDPF